jgi:GNAT superfamily N-acetyltransferase
MEEQHMPPTIEYAPTAAFSLEVLAELFTRSFEGYFYPAVLTAEGLAWRARIEAIDLWRSVVLHVGGQPAGIALLSVRGATAWCGGFGIMPAFRGRGLAHGLAAELVSRAQEAGAARLRLEVLTRNQQALRTYERAGLRTFRDLLVLEWRRPEEWSPPGTQDDVPQAEPRALLSHFDALHRHEPAWQRDLPSLLARWPLEGYALDDPLRPTAYVLARPGDEGAALIADLAALDATDAMPLIAALQVRYQRLTSVNEVAGSPAAQALLAAGFVEADRQHEMELRY